MGVFEYIGVLVSVIMGLGIAHLATGAVKLIQHRDEAKPYLPHALWTLNVLLYILLIWWSMFWWSGHETWHAYEYLFIALYAIVLFLLAAMLYPWDMDRDIDVQAYFFANRRWFFGTLFVAWLLDIPETLLKGSTGLRDVPADYVIFVAVNLANAAIGFFARNRIVHLALPVIWLIAVVYYVSLSLVGQIST